MGEFIPALRFRFATSLYDPIVRWTTREAAFKRVLVHTLAAKPGERILDLGCGTGTLAIAIARKAAGAEIHGIDADPVVIERAKVKQIRAAVTVNWRQGFAQSLPFIDGFFDAAVSSLFFHHLRRADKVAALAEVARVMRPGGRLFIADWGQPASSSARARFLIVRALDGFETTRDSVEGLLPQLIAEAGFSSITLVREFATPLGTLAIHRAGYPGGRRRPSPPDGEISGA